MTKPKLGRPSVHTPELAAKICERLAAGETLRAVCRYDGMPDERTVRSWALDNVNGFSPQYTRAREIGYQSMADEILEIADTPQEGVRLKNGPKGAETMTGDMIEHRRLQVDTRKWLLSKALPKVYGDKVDFNASLDVAPSTGDPSDIRELARRMLFGLSLALRAQAAEEEGERAHETPCAVH